MNRRLEIEAPGQPAGGLRRRLPAALFFLLLLLLSAFAHAQDQDATFTVGPAGLMGLKSEGCAAAFPALDLPSVALPKAAASVRVAKKRKGPRLSTRPSILLGTPARLSRSPAR